MSGGMGGSNVCKCKHHMIVPVGTIVIGALFVLQSLGWFYGMGTTLLIGAIFIVIGVMKLKGKSCKCCDRP